MQIDAKKFLNRLETLKTLRPDTLAEDVMEFFFPFRSVTKNININRLGSEGLYDGTGQRSAYTLAAVMQSSLMGQASEWFKFRFVDEKYNDDHELSKVVQRIEKITKNYLQCSNFYPEMGSFFHEGVVLPCATAFCNTIYDQIRRRNVLNITNLPFEQVWIGENEDHRVDTVYRVWTQTARNLVTMFKDNLTKGFIAAAKKEPDKPFDVLHVVEPVKDSDYLPHNNTHKWISLYTLLEKSHDTQVLSGTDDGLDGFPNFPYFNFRWLKVNGNPYAFTPAMFSLPDCRVLNKIIELQLKAVENAILPSGFIRAASGEPSKTVQFRPGVFMTMRDVSENSIRFAPPMGNPGFVNFVIKEYQAVIKSALYIDQVTFPSLETQGTPATATEISYRNAYANRILAPIFGRFTYETADPAMDRIVFLINEMGGYTENGVNLFEVLETAGAAVYLEYEGPLARNQRFEETIAIDEMLAFAGQNRQIVPEVDDVINMSESIRERSIIRGFPARLLYSPEDSKKREKARMQMIQQQQQMQLLNIGADSAAKASKFMQGTGAPA